MRENNFKSYNSGLASRPYKELVRGTAGTCYNPNTWEAEAERSQVQKLKQLSETLSQRGLGMCVAQ